MKSNEKNVEIAKYWIIKAKESLKSAQLEYEQKLLSFATNRLYYAAFYAASSVLASRGQSYGKHSAVRASVHRDFVKTGLLSLEQGKLYDQLFFDRQEGDYVAFTEFDESVIKQQITKVKDLIDRFEKIFKEEAKLS